ncbi:carbamoyltransferase HypF [Lentiprolixibacter aurantiacus]|uniref:Carbamoyltransferase n=1 Tax=Lentiprolixibacter aurantiacus TaxID=2993939 RepID=A0AAE3MN31_9FLAO|nr:carbamoyltransferase HypF [Lentiprolixibacter aurantiacus]MCX2720366.1 carbamoyltransferase HypF [Lentiprolixibacter aurantiacus]
MIKSFKVIITGQVQGVGFRPYVYVLAKQLDLTGTVSNNEEGVIIYLTGKEENIRSFVSQLIENPPKVSRINTHTAREIVLKDYEDFSIIPSKKGSKLNLQLTPDFAICPDCAGEILDASNRRYNYPFTTCVNCGPRWAITNTFPFERNHTSIVEFTMCPECEREYTDPLDRRFHSQTNSCSKCGIGMELTDSQGEILQYLETELFEKIGELLKSGAIIALKNTSGYLLCCDATNPETVQRLRDKKNRPNKPFAILYPSFDLLERELRLTNKHREALSSAERPIVIIQKEAYKGSLALKELAPGLNQLGIMMPYTGILQLLAEHISMPIVATSGNFHGSPIISDNEDCFQTLQSVADYFVHHNMPVSNPQDDSLVKFSSKFHHEVIFRRSRGYAPNYFGKVHSGKEKILAMGGHLKSTIGFIPNDYIYLSQYLGNLDNYDVYTRFTQTANRFMEIFEQKPDTILVDSHPEYQSTQFGKELSKELSTNLFHVQHHKAHFASVLGEHDLFERDGPVMGVIWDGTGYGDDGNIWGGEFFSYQDGQIDRIGHLQYFDWLAGDKMAREPRLSLLSLSDNHMEDTLSRKFTSQEINIYKSIRERNKLKTSSVGRLFDAVASLLGICDYNTYEGEAAILLENNIKEYDLSACKSYASLPDTGNIPTQLLLKNLYNDYANGTSRENIIASFLYTLAHLVFEMADKHKISDLAFSGGVFQNTTLIDMLIELAGTNYKLYFNRNLSPNDENVSFGQINYHIYCSGNKKQ